MAVVSNEVEHTVMSSLAMHMLISMKVKNQLSGGVL